jgi:hypothetical protein
VDVGCGVKTASFLFSLIGQKFEIALYYGKALKQLTKISQKFFLKNFLKMLDKQGEMWYNVIVRKRENKRRD